MKCPWVYGEKIKYCAAVSGLVVVSLSELEEFCNGNDECFNQCPVYKEKTKRSGTISLQNYFSICLRM